MLIVTEADFSSLRCRQRTTLGGRLQGFWKRVALLSAPSEAALLFLVDFWRGHHQAHVARARSNRQWRAPCASNPKCCLWMRRAAAGEAGIAHLRSHHADGERKHRTWG